MAKIELERETFIYAESYGPDDQYTAVDLGRIQIMHENFSHGDRVKVTITIEKMEDKDANLQG